MNLLPKHSELKPVLTSQNSIKDCVDNSLNFDLSYLINQTKENPKNNNSLENSIDDCLVDIADEKMLEANDDTLPKEISVKNSDIKLNDICIRLEDIKPSSIPPLTILSDRNGLTITLHFVKDKPKNDVHVFVVTTTSRNELPITNYLFQAVVPKVSCLI